jgi:hypothetical protein
MRRLAQLLSLTLLTGAMAVSAAPALATTDWAVNGTALAPGQEVPVKFMSVTPIQVLVPQMGVDITCASWKAKGTLVGGTQGTGELIKPHFAHCTENENGSLVSVKLHTLEHVHLQTDTEHPAGMPSTIEIGVLELCFAKGRCEPASGIKGILDSVGPDTTEGNLVDFPQPPLPGSTLMLGAANAEIVGKAVFKLQKHATLSQVEL